MIRKINCNNQKRGGMVLLNSILVLSVAILIVGYSNAYLSEQVDDYQQLDKLYKRQIKNYINKSNKINYWETRNP